MGGADAVLNAGSHHHTYSYDVKLAVVKDRLENGLTVREAMIKHKIPSESSVKAWCRQYRESVRPHWSISRAVASRALKRRNSKRDGAPTGRIFLAAPTF
ncbi:MAG: helix-turn-helix domain-containing protein [Collinsella sp.]